MESSAKLEEISAAVGRVLAEAEADIASRKPVCQASGKCCKFDSYGHRLYVTAAEVMHFAKTQNAKRETQNRDIQNEKRRVSLGQYFVGETQGGCPYQVEGLCMAREARPLGCRVYFCDANAQAWQNEVYEKYHAKLRAVHEEFGVGYWYREWREALRGIFDF